MVNNEMFVEATDQMQQAIHEWSDGKGFWDDNKKLLALAPEMAEQITRLMITVKVMLVITELAEKVEGLRNMTGPSDHIPEYSNMEEEAADAVIRIMDLCEHYNLRLGQAIVAKMEYNHGRTHKHGKQF